jgi:hypothetical protein
MYSPLNSEFLSSKADMNLPTSHLNMGVRRTSYKSLVPHTNYNVQHNTVKLQQSKCHKPVLPFVKHTKWQVFVSEPVRPMKRLAVASFEPNDTERTRALSSLSRDLSPPFPTVMMVSTCIFSNVFRRIFKPVWQKQWRIFNTVCNYNNMSTNNDVIPINEQYLLKTTYSHSHSSPQPHLNTDTLHGQESDILTF